jgi:hypothetical protein
MNPTNPQPKTTRHLLNEAYEYGFEADEFDPDLANAALNEIDSRLHKLIAQAKREAAIAELESLSMEVVEPCEPDCDEVRHARHEGSCNAHLAVEARLATLRAQRDTDAA